MYIWVVPVHDGGSAVPGPHPPSSGLMQDPRAVAAMWGLNMVQVRVVILSVDVIIVIPPDMMPLRSK